MISGLPIALGMYLVNLHEGVEHFAYFVDNAQVVNIGKSESIIYFCAFHLIYTDNHYYGMRIKLL